MQGPLLWFLWNRQGGAHRVGIVSFGYFQQAQGCGTCPWLSVTCPGGLGQGVSGLSVSPVEEEAGAWALDGFACERHTLWRAVLCL